ncbi:hypothetical protein B0H17DRAFT_1141646 [Mycena rosella]|uniref:Uncharacterized protein n=1 Tax=Mycena rosella TaxID=1033263 RepID=A0AAD7G9Z3_MYCRO|nr:hypothetical protein B0H17DRAFT_1141646 [Mycena rosella]
MSWLSPDQCASGRDHQGRHREFNGPSRAVFTMVSSPVESIRPHNMYMTNKVILELFAAVGLFERGAVAPKCLGFFQEHALKKIEEKVENSRYLWYIPRALISPAFTSRLGPAPRQSAYLFPTSVGNFGLPDHLLHSAEFLVVLGNMPAPPPAARDPSSHCMFVSFTPNLAL